MFTNTHGEIRKIVIRKGKLPVGYVKINIKSGWITK
jgi:hypothetical protein